MISFNSSAWSADRTATAESLTDTLRSFSPSCLTKIVARQAADGVGSRGTASFLIARSLLSTLEAMLLRRMTVSSPAAEYQRDRVTMEQNANRNNTEKSNDENQWNRQYKRYEPMNEHVNTRTMRYHIKTNKPRKYSFTYPKQTRKLPKLPLRKKAVKSV